MHGDDLPDWVTDLTSSLDDKMGVIVEEVTADRVAVRAPVAGNTQPVGLWHGGASGVLVETLGSLGALAHGRPQGLAAVGIELSVSHHRAARGGWVHGVATASHLGARVASYTAELTDDEGRLLATGRITCMLVPIG